MFAGNGSDDDEDEFTLSPTAKGGSRLANLFSSGREKGSNESLTYSAPKQPKKPDPAASQTSSGNQLALLYVSTVNAFKLVDGKYASQGKLGAAILGNHQLHLYKLLLYKGQQQQLCFASIAQEFLFVMQPNNYANFYNDKGENWSVMFDSVTDAIDFAKQVALAKANSIASTLTSVISQELVLGEGPAIKADDLVELSYQGCLFMNNTFGAVFESSSGNENLMKFKIGKGKTIKGLEEGCVGMKKNGKRLLIIPPSLAFGSQGYKNKVPVDSVVIYEVHVTRVKSTKDLTSRASTPASLDSETAEIKKVVEASPKHTAENVSDDVRARGASISEQLAQTPKTDKAKLISRMAKMGMSLLPAAPAPQSSESENEENLSHPELPPTPPLPSKSKEGSPKPKPKPRTESLPRNQHPQQMGDPNFQAMPQYQQPAGTAGGQLSLYHSNQQPYPPGAMPFYPNQMPMYQPPYPQMMMPPPVAYPSMPAHTPVEQNSSLGLLTEKLDSVLSKLLDNKMSDKQDENFSSASKSTVSSVLSDIQETVKANLGLIEEVNKKNANIQVMYSKVEEFLKKNQSQLSGATSPVTETDSAASGKINILQQEKEKLELEVKSQLEQIKRLQDELSSSQKKFSEVEIQLKQSHDELQRHKDTSENINVQKKELDGNVTDLTSKLNEANNLNENLKREVSELKKTIEEIKQRLETSQEGSGYEVLKMKSQIEELEQWKVKYEESAENSKQIKSRCEAQITDLTNHIRRLESRKGDAGPNMEAEIKNVMNRLYKLMQQDIVKEETYSGQDVIQIAIGSIRTVTLQYLNSIQPPPDPTPDEPDRDKPKEEPVASAPIPSKEQENGSVTEERPSVSQEKKVEVNANESSKQSWKPQPPPAPPQFFDDEADEDDWIK